MILVLWMKTYYLNMSIPLSGYCKNVYNDINVNLTDYMSEEIELWYL